MIIIGILSVAAISRFSGTEDFDRRTFYDESLAALRYAQKSAIAQRRNVCVTFTDTTVTLTAAGASGSAVACTGGGSLPLASPADAAPFIVTARSGVTFSPTPAAFQFNALGRASAGQAITIMGFSPQSIVVEQETGYVHP